MIRRVRTRVTYANVVSTLGLFLVLTGGTAMALDGSLPGQNTVGSLDVINGEIKTDDLGENSIGSNKIIDKQVKNQDLGAGASNTATIQDAGVFGIDVKDNTLESVDVKDNTLTGVDIDELSLSGVNAAALNGRPASALPQSIDIDVPFNTVVPATQVGPYEIRVTCVADPEGAEASFEVRQGDQFGLGANADVHGEESIDEDPPTSRAYGIGVQPTDYNSVAATSAPLGSYARFEGQLVLHGSAGPSRVVLFHLFADGRPEGENCTLSGVSVGGS